MYISIYVYKYVYMHGKYLTCFGMVSNRAFRENFKSDI